MKKALISVSDKTNLIKLAQSLISHGYAILSTGGTKKTLDDHHIPVTQVSDYTGFPEILDGRVKTLHPKIHGGLLARRDHAEHMETLAQHQIDFIDMVVVNLYPFEKTILKEGVTRMEAIEQIDIGGPSMLRSAAKNMDFVTVLTDINDYDLVINELKQFGDTTPETRRLLAQKVFTLTANYDMMISNYLSGQTRLTQTWHLHDTLRYGENPHQKGYLYQSQTDDPYSLFHAQILHGKQLSYNNIQDANAAINIIAEFNEPCVVALKHMNPCGVGVASTIIEAYRKAYASDEVSIFGGIIAINREVTLELAKRLNETFLEMIIAPSFDDNALLELTKKKNIRLLTLDMNQMSTTRTQMTSINGGILVQDVDDSRIDDAHLQCVTHEKPSEDMMKELWFAWRVVKHVKSNAIVLSKNHQTVGIGAGQMNRIGSAKIAFEWAAAHGQREDIVLASDAFFPFSDIVELAKQYGVKGIIQPGGSVRDQDSIDLCNQLGIPMIFTGIRHFKH
jgi:phosphoribosylaminoimidazolecarboxamide formyltransferase / IMP cyclohydrolase